VPPRLFKAPVHAWRRCLGARHLITVLPVHDLRRSLHDG
jgi:hypothetical protein